MNLSIVFVRLSALKSLSKPYYIVSLVFSCSLYHYISFFCIASQLASRCLLTSTATPPSSSSYAQHQYVMTAHFNQAAQTTRALYHGTPHQLTISVVLHLSHVPCITSRLLQHVPSFLEAVAQTSRCKFLNDHRVWRVSDIPTNIDAHKRSLPNEALTIPRKDDPLITGAV